MNIQTSQIQLKISLSEQLNDCLESKAARLGVPVTQFVKHLILKEVENERKKILLVAESLDKEHEIILRKDKDQIRTRRVWFAKRCEGSHPRRRLQP